MNIIKSDYILFNNSLSTPPTFLGKMNKGLTSRVAEEGLNTVTKTIAGIAGAGTIAALALNNDEFIKESKQPDELLKDNIKSHLSRETYIVAKQIYAEKPEAMDSFLDFTFTKYLIIRGKGENTTQIKERIKKLIEEVICERLNNKKLPEDFSDIQLNPPGNNKFYYTDFILSKETLEELFSRENSLVKIAETLQLPYTTLLKYIQKNGISSQKQERKRRSDEIPDDEIIKLCNEGKNIVDIMRIFQTTRHFIMSRLERLGIKTRSQTNYAYNQEAQTREMYNKMSFHDLQDYFLEIYCNDKIQSNEELKTVLDFMFDNYNNEERDRESIIEISQLLDEFLKNKIELKDVLSNGKITQVAQSHQESLTLQNEIFELKEKYHTLLNNPKISQNSNLSDYMIKYLPITDEEKDLANAEFVINTINSNITSLKRAERLLAYFDLDNSADSKLLKAAKSYAQENSAAEELDCEKAGQYIINAQIYKKYIETGNTSGYPEEFLEILKDSNLPKDLLIKYLIRIENWDTDSNKTYINDFLKFFSQNDGKIEAKLIKAYIDNFYLKADTQVKLIINNKHSIMATFDKSAKGAIYRYQKFPNCVKYFSKFEEAMQKNASKSGEAGVKTWCHKGCDPVYEVKIIGYQDRLKSSRNDLVFDIYEPRHN